VKKTGGKGPQEPDDAHKAEHVVGAIIAVRAFQRARWRLAGNAAKGMMAAIVDLMEGLGYLCEREGLSFEGLLQSAVQYQRPEATHTRLMEASNAELTATIRGIRDAYAKRLPAKDQKLWRTECDELAAWIDEAN
jgi:hypothetical protein